MAVDISTVVVVARAANAASSERFQAALGDVGGQWSLVAQQIAHDLPRVPALAIVTGLMDPQATGSVRMGRVDIAIDGVRYVYISDEALQRISVFDKCREFIGKWRVQGCGEGDRIGVDFRSERVYSMSKSVS